MGEHAEDPPGDSEKPTSAETKRAPGRLSTKIIDDVFTDAVSLVKPRFEVDYGAYLERLWEANPDIAQLLRDAANLEAARDTLYAYLDRAERAVFERDNDLHILEKATVRECVRAFRSIIGPINEARTGVSALQHLWELARATDGEPPTEVSVGFLMEFINLFRGVAGRSNIYLENAQVKKGMPEFLRLEGREAALARSDMLDELGASMGKYFRKYPFRHRR